MRGLLPPDPKPVRNLDEAIAEDRREFKVAVLAVDGRCLVHDDPADCGGPLQAHHVISQQQLRKNGLARFLWDPANGMTACERGHRRHTLAVERIPAVRVPARCFKFAAEHGLLRLLDPPLYR